MRNIPICAVFLAACYSNLPICEASHKLHKLKAKLAGEKPNFDTLEYVHVIWRHGDRTPALPLWNEKEIFAEKWSEGQGELTRKGMAQQYRLGDWMRSRYSGFLGDRFDRAEIYVRSSDYNRTLMSAQANMAGMFPPKEHEIWNKSLLWQPVPVHTMPREMDIQINQEADCPVAKAELDRIWNSEEVLKMKEQNKELLTFLGEKFNKPDLQLQDLWIVYDNLFCQQCHNDTHQWPEWMTDTIFKRLVRVYDVTSQFEYHTDLLRRLRGGSLLKEIFERFKAKASGTLSKKTKFFAYSAHDSTIAALLASMGIFLEVFPLYATAVLLELHKVDGKYILEIYHKNITDSPLLYEYEIPGCPIPCSLDKMHEDLIKFFPDNWNEECGLPSNDQSAKKYIVTIIVLAVTCILLAVILVTDFWLHRRKRHRIVSGMEGRSGARPLISDAEEDGDDLDNHEI
ncbi:hypothetical protein WR25_01434 [Diploscapter pachys]|uniref:Acid phosphatase n=1 Tax=Diploscapter pachys TaxID=2018661 RepID=A0A2A2JP90_9BILA|nr:hypothetical protein WR25_01434 [Diploscapter pachys]